MKNLVLAFGALVIIILIAFLFSTKNDSGTEDIFIPGQATSGASPVMNEADNQPFPVLEKSQIDGKKARIETAKGGVVFELLSNSPLASSNFIFLTNKKFYDGLTFHRREEGFVIQGGDPNGDGTGGPGYKFADEAITGEYTRGTVAMANSGPNTNGSQFFIMLEDTPTLPKNYTIFGRVVEGMDVVDKIEIGDVMEEVVIE